MNALTNKDDLLTTLQKLNKHTPVDCRVDASGLVQLRDALAHGRAFGFGPMKDGSCLRLVKFGGKKDQDGRVQVTMAVDMTGNWFSQNLGLLMDAMAKVTKALDYETCEF